MTDKPQERRVEEDASERPGAIVIRPERNNDMVYDPETGRTTDTRTGERFGVRLYMRSGGIYSAGIIRADGSAVYEYELKKDEIRSPDKTIKRLIWQVFWARRGDWMERFDPLVGRSGDAQEKAQVEAQNDSLERLAQFLRRQHEGIFQNTGSDIEGEVVVVDRRLENTDGERVW